MKYFNIVGKSNRFLNGLSKELSYRFLKPRKICFDHLPKCGGTSFKEYLRGNYPERKIFTINGLDPITSIAHFQSLSQIERYSYDLIQGHLANQLFGYINPTCLKVTIIRDPIERIISYYNFARSNEQHYLFTKIKELDLDLVDFVKSGLTSEVQNWYTCHFSGLSMVEVNTNPEASVQKALAGLKQYDIVGLLDDLPLFLNKLRERARLNPNTVIKHLNDSPQKAVSELRTPNSELRTPNSIDILFYKQLSESIKHMKEY